MPTNAIPTNIMTRSQMVIGSSWPVVEPAWSDRPWIRLVVICGFRKTREKSKVRHSLMGSRGTPRGGDVDIPGFKFRT